MLDFLIEVELSAIMPSQKLEISMYWGIVEIEKVGITWKESDIG